MTADVPGAPCRARHIRRFDSDQSFFGSRASKGSISAGERIPMNQARQAIGQGKAMRGRLRSRPRRTMRAARSASIRNGIGNLLEAVIWLLMKPGMMTLTPTPLGERLPRRDSPQTRTAALDAP